MSEQACSFVADFRKADCKVLLSELLSSQERFFLSPLAELTRGDLAQSKADLTLSLTKRAFAYCNEINCCSAQKLASPAVLPILQETRAGIKLHETLEQKHSHPQADAPLQNSMSSLTASGTGETRPGTNSYPYGVMGMPSMYPMMPPMMGYVFSVHIYIHI